MSNYKYTVAEIFCGCGGFSYGFEMQGDFETVLGVDIKPEALNTFKLNHQSSTIIQKDVREIEDVEILNILKDKGVEPYELDVLIGGPPCQGFSQMRRSNSRDKHDVARFTGYSKLAEDKRNDLVLRFLEIAEVLMPKCIVIENVKQVKNHVLNGREGGFILSIEEVLEELGYDVKHSIFNAADYGVPQLRERAVILASRKGEVTFPAPTHGQNWVTVGEAIKDLPTPAMKVDSLYKSDLGIYAHEANTDYLNTMRRGVKWFTANHNTRTYKDDIINLISSMPQGKNWSEVAESKRREYEVLLQRFPEEERKDAYDRLVEDGTIMPAFYKDYYWSAYTRLDPQKPALTITANANFLGSGRYTHPYENRGITPREAARLQSFPDRFIFYSSKKGDASTERQGVIMDMIGEAVPPLLSRAIAQHIISHELLG
ncbi:DNA cytosine methyltransferase [Vibrio breoganii]|uniref:Cytosine-specific methyltransferase n=1 Tax=Vibrio breoganii TaxID=553239 RepID=A0ABX1UE83_9VIBR|nr:DNA cytosine methyltransferase [Vibrio breoganii]NMO75235.1 DNA (cytosine-5-)-methyltransferase [Vibrio breoganii]NMR71751.1 DNA (cytosine-5-)-methyltransferase [Vibrio breoganii]PML82821.1 hypothetical protein BCT67_17960 [Vibrio breoganii]